MKQRVQCRESARDIRKASWDENLDLCNRIYIGRTCFGRVALEHRAEASVDASS